MKNGHKKNEFGFIIKQKISHRMTVAKLKEKFYQFLNQRRRDLMQTLQLPENEVCTNFCYYRDGREFQGILRAMKKCTKRQLKAIQNQNKKLWEAGNSGPYSMTLYTHF